MAIQAEQSQKGIAWMDEIAGNGMAIFAIGSYCFNGLQEILHL